MNLIEILIIIIATSFVFSTLAKKFHFSKTIGLIISGILLSSLFCENCISIEYERLFSILSIIGLFALMFIDGMEVSWRMIVKEEKDALKITIASCLTTLSLGTFLFILIGFSFETAIIIGTCLCITAEASKARALLQLKKIKTRIASLMIDTGIFNDIIGVVILSFISYFFIKSIPLAELFSLVGAIIFFLLGILVHHKIGRLDKKIKNLEHFLHLFIVPFFFVHIGANFNIKSLHVDIFLLIFIVIMSIVLPIIGVFISRPFVKIKIKQLFLIGLSMSSKGAVEIAIAFIAFQLGLISSFIYSSLIAASLITTILFQIILFQIVNHNPKIMK